MDYNLHGINVSVLGGDQRELVLINKLIQLGATVKAVGFSSASQLTGGEKVVSIEVALSEADAVILPMPGTDKSGNIRTIFEEEGKLTLTKDHLKQLTPGTPVIVGLANDYLREWSHKYNLNLLEIAEIDEVAILNAIPTAEGTIQLLMEQSPITIHNSNAFILGFGRVGFTVARIMSALGSKVTIVVRKEADMARGYELGYEVATYENLHREISKANFVINTVPARVLDRNMLTYIPLDSLIIDLASQPGGTDFQAAKEIGLNAILAPGLPGKVAPITAGAILAKAIPKLIRQYVKTKGAGGVCSELNG